MGTMTLATSALGKIWYLNKVSLFKGMTSHEMDRVHRMTTMKTFRKKEPIYLMGQPGKSVYILKKGVVKVSKILPDGRELVLALLKPGEIFGELEAVNEEDRQTQAEAHDEVMICVISRNDFLQVIQSKPELGVRLSKIIGFRRRIIENKLENLIFKTIPQKLGVLLLELAEQFGKKESQGILIDLALTHQDIANLVAASRTTVTETFQAFKEQGFIDVQDRRIRLMKPEALRSLSA
jgi:CRP/FNR family transcriptional regulator, cyclic AMP receptor protein